VVTPPTALRRSTLGLLAVAAGISAANLYYSQPLLPKMSASLHTTTGVIGLVPVLTQVGYVCGLMLIVPLTDVVEPKHLMGWMALQTTVMLVAVALARSATWLLIASFALGASTVVPQLAVPTAARRSGDAQRGRAVGTVMAGLLIGVVLSRAYAGLLASVTSWRWVYGAAALLRGAVSVSLWLLVPYEGRTRRETYLAVLGSLGAVVRSDRTLRRAALLSALMFGALSCFWVTVSFYVEGAPYHAGPAMVGFLALVGAAGALAAPRVGRLGVEQSGRLIAVAIAGGLVAFAMLGVLGGILVCLVIGTLTIDAGTQVNEVANLVRVMADRTRDHGRANTIFMGGLFVGGAVGSGLGDLAYSQFGWAGACTVGALLCAVALAVHLGRSRLPRRRPVTEGGR
jgi:predicted MFS family arabinose efflux permease